MSALALGVGGRLEVSLPTFEGPLDLLSHLVQRGQVDILKIPIAALTADHLEGVSQATPWPLEPASEFLVLAGALLASKSRALLPRPPAEAPCPEDELPDPREALLARLLTHQRYREVAEALEALPRLGREYFTRPPGQDRPADEQESPLVAEDVARLGASFLRLARRRPFESPHQVQVERVTIAERVAQVAADLATAGMLPFASLCGPDRHREEHDTTLLAALELARLALIHLEQPEPFAPLILRARVEGLREAGERAAGHLAAGPAAREPDPPR